MTEKKIEITLIKDETGVINNIKLSCECTIMDMLVAGMLLLEKASEYAKKEDSSLVEIMVKHIQAKKILDVALMAFKASQTEETPKETEQTE